MESVMDRVSYLTKCIDPESDEFDAVTANTADFDDYTEACRFANTLLSASTDREQLVGVPTIEAL
jgi:hypothetical protein